MLNKEKQQQQLTDADMVMVPMYIVEKDKHRYFRIIRLLVILNIIVFLAFAAYAFYQSTFETVTIQQEATTDGDSQAYLNGTGELTYNGDEGEADNNIAP